jgi:hypothetical protein
MTSIRRSSPLTGIIAGFVAVFWVNYYIIHDVFHVVQTGRMNSMQGFWMTIARLADTQWFHAGWWPYWDGGSPFEFTYAPLTPGLIAIWSHLAGIPPSQAYFCVTALYYILGALTLYIFAVWLTDSAAIATAAGFCYTLLSPATLLVPDDRFYFTHLLLDRRAYLTGVWDDTPHMGAVVILPLLWVFLGRVLLHGKRRDVVISILLMSLEVAASAFGPVLVIFSAVCLIFAFSRDAWFRKAALIARLGIVAYLIASPSLPPSLIANIRQNAHAHFDSPWNVSSFAAVSAVILAWILIWRWLRKWTEDERIHLVVFLALVTFSIPALSWYSGRAFVPQPGRYKMEMDLTWALLLAIAGGFGLRKLPRSVAAGVTLLLISLGAEQVVNHRHYAKEIFVPVDITRTLDYQEARFVDSNLGPEARIFSAGSTSQWFNLFSDRPQFSGSSFSTAYNPVQQIAFKFIFAGDGANAPQAERAILWMKAFGVQAISVPGKTSPETWHPFASPNKFDGLLTPIWNGYDTTIYRIPLRSASLAHVVEENALVRNKPRQGDDTVGIQRFVAALDDPLLPTAAWQWKGHDAAVVDADVAPGRVIAMQVSYHPGWHARVNGVAVPLHPDGLGLMWLKPPASGSSHVELRYDGGWEMSFFRITSLVATLLLGVYALFGWPAKSRLQA